MVVNLGDRDRLLAALEAAEYVITDVARASGYSRQAIYDAMQRHGIQRKKMSRARWSQLQRERGGRPRRQAVA